MIQKALFAAGCFWEVQADFDSLDANLETTVGYSGGTTRNPSYEKVHSGVTGHAETIKVIYDNSEISYEELLDHFFKIHDPTSDYKRHSTDYHYRSIIFYYTEEQKESALKIIKQLERQRIFSSKITTEVKKAQDFYPAEEYHQKYYEKKLSRKV